MVWRSLNYNCCDVGASECDTAPHTQASCPIHVYLSHLVTTDCSRLQSFFCFFNIKLCHLPSQPKFHSPPLTSKLPSHGSAIWYTNSLHSSGHSNECCYHAELEMRLAQRIAQQEEYLRQLFTSELQYRLQAMAWDMYNDLLRVIDAKLVGQ